MTSLKNKVARATAIGLVFTLSHVGLSAGVVSAAPSTSLVAAQAEVQGRLTTRGNNSVTVNGNSAKSGETIFSGQSIQTPAGVGATVNLPGLGHVDIAPGSNLTLNFEDGKINVVLISGCVILTANKGTTGTLDAGAAKQQTDPATGSALDVCTSTVPGGAPIVGQGAASAAGAGASGTSAAAASSTAAAGGAVGGTSGGLFGLGTAGTIGFIASAGIIAATAIIAPCRRGSNPSPGDPRGRNDECRD